MDTCYELSHPIPFSFTFCPAQGYSLRFLAPTQVYELPIGFSSKVPPKPLTNALLYMLLVLQLKPPLSVINPQHQPFMSLNSNKNTKPAMIQSLAQQKNNTTTIDSYKLFLLHKLQNNFNPKTRPPPLPLNPPSYLGPTASYSHLPCMLEVPLATHCLLPTCFT